MNEEVLQAVAVAIAQAFNLDKQEQVLQILQNMTEDGIKSVIQVLSSTGKDDKKLYTIQKIVQDDLKKSQAAKKEYGGKLNYIKQLKLV